jgi:small subunit ribosomal protein S8
MIMRHDLLADAFVTMKNAEDRGKRSCIVQGSKIIKEVLRIMQKDKYIGKFEFIDNGKNGEFKIELLGRINYCGVIRPRFEVGKDGFIQWEKRYLPSVNLGIIFVTTPKGIMDHREAKKQKTGGALLGYVY